MRIENDLKLGFSDVLFRPKRSTLSSRSQVDLERTFRFINAQRQWTGVPVIAANMDTVGTFEIAMALADFKVLTAVHKHYSIDEWHHFLQDKKNSNVHDYVMISTGVSTADYQKLTTILTAHPKLSMICIDVANGYTEAFVEFVAKVRQAFPDKVIVAGNVVTGEMVEQLILNGADIIKVGIGPGSVCTTRVKTGVGYPQLSAVIECADAAHGLGGQIISDGGCTCPGDVAKAFGGGADFVMLGGLLAAHEESGGEIYEEQGVMYKSFYGMSSATAMEKHAGGVADYRASEGKAIGLPFRGPVSGTIRDILGGIRSTCTYVGAKQLKELSKCTTFIRVAEQENQVYS
ncbi:MAG: GMP reductase [Endozoicomonadaceae bacterium]|nr:GMP reductase [Endozoicomonadaceae bacterium]